MFSFQMSIKRLRIKRYRWLYQMWWKERGKRADEICNAMNATWDKMSNAERAIAMRGMK